VIKRCGPVVVVDHDSESGVGIAGEYRDGDDGFGDRKTPWNVCTACMGRQNWREISHALSYFDLKKR
jgi:hypothetical protein